MSLTISRVLKGVKPNFFQNTVLKNGVNRSELIQLADQMVVAGTHVEGAFAVGQDIARLKSQFPDSKVVPAQVGAFLSEPGSQEIDQLCRHLKGLQDVGGAVFGYGLHSNNDDAQKVVDLFRYGLQSDLKFEPKNAGIGPSLKRSLAFFIGMAKSNLKCNADRPYRMGMLVPGYAPTLFMMIQQGVQPVLFSPANLGGIDATIDKLCQSIFQNQIDGFIWNDKNPGFDVSDDHISELRTALSQNPQFDFCHDGAYMLRGLASPLSDIEHDPTSNRVFMGSMSKGMFKGPALRTSMHWGTANFKKSYQDMLLALESSLGLGAHLFRSMPTDQIKQNMINNHQLSQQNVTAFSESFNNTSCRMISTPVAGSPFCNLTASNPILIELNMKELSHRLLMPGKEKLILGNLSHSMGGGVSPLFSQFFLKPVECMGSMDQLRINPGYLFSDPQKAHEMGRQYGSKINEILSA